MGIIALNNTTDAHHYKDNYIQIVSNTGMMELSKYDIKIIIIEIKNKNLNYTKRFTKSGNIFTYSRYRNKLTIFGLKKGYIELSGRQEVDNFVKKMSESLQIV